MNTFYWITRLDSIDHLLFGFIVLSFLTFFVCLIGFGIALDEDYDENKENPTVKYFKRTGIVSFVVAVVLSTINTFLPSTEDGYLIWGIGGTFEYLKSSDKAKELPDKVIEAVDAYLDLQIDKLQDSKEETDSVK